MSGSLYENEIRCVNAIVMPVCVQLCRNIIFKFFFVRLSRHACFSFWCTIRPTTVINPVPYEIAADELCHKLLRFSCLQACWCTGRLNSAWHRLSNVWRSMHKWKSCSYQIIIKTFLRLPVEPTVWSCCDFLSIRLKLPPFSTSFWVLV